MEEKVDERLLRFESETGIERVTLARNALVAALSFYEKHGVISFPLQVVANRAAQTGRPDPERMAKLRPEDRGTPVKNPEVPAKSEFESTS